MMSISNKMLMAVVAASVVSTSTPLLADDDTGFYIGASVNRASATFDDDRDIESDFDDSDNAFGIKAGYMFTDLLGVEIGYLDLGEFSTDGNRTNNALQLDADGYSAALVLNWSVLDQLDLYAKGGAFRVSAKSDSFIAGRQLRVDDDATEPFAAFGVEWDLGAVNLFAEYAVIDTDINDLSVDLASAGVKFEF